MTRTLAIIGYPLKHSLSPVFQQAAFDHLGLGLRYEAWEVPPQRLSDAVARLRLPENLGANITIPHKEAVMAHLDALEPEAKAIGAVNTIVKDGNRLRGYNTDVSGFLAALREEGGWEPGGKACLVLGAGGAARAVVYGLLSAGASRVLIANRSLNRAQALAGDMSPFASPGQEVRAVAWQERADALGACSLAVNATALGMAHSPGEGQSPLQAGEIPRGVLIYDLVYNPIETPLLKEAKKAGTRTVGGLGMLIHQGGAAFELWTGKKAPLDIMFQAARKTLAGGEAK